MSGALAELFASLTLDELVKMLVNPVSAAMAYVDLFLGEKAGQRISLLWNPHRLDTPRCDAESVFANFRKETFASGLARACLFKKGKVSDLLYAAIELNVNGAGYVNEFQPYVARDLYRRFCTPDARVLDPCAGWGGRLLGASCHVQEYVGFEPATATCDGLRAMHEQLISKFRPEFSCILHCLPFEDAQIDGVFDFAFTSPPYFDTERYSEEETQSWKRYPTAEQWRSGFFKPLIHKTLSALKSGGSFVLNVGTRREDMMQWIAEECEPLGHKVSSLGNLLAGHAGLRGSESGERFAVITKVEV